MRKKSKFDKIREKCQFWDICDCGQSELCDHEENPDGFCEEENCPKIK